MGVIPETRRQPTGGVRKVKPKKTIKEGVVPPKVPKTPDYHKKGYVPPKPPQRPKPKPEKRD